MADFSSLLPAMSNLSDKNLRANTANAPITSHKIIDPVDNPTLFAVGINSKALSKIIAAAATSKAAATKYCDRFFLAATTTQPIMVARAARSESVKPTWVLSRLTTKPPLELISPRLVNKSYFENLS